jgi:TRAP-type C4-dicarboxylate transport system permease small subunit
LLKFLRAISKLSKLTNSIAGITLVLMMFLTVTDVILRYLGKPITGTFELTSFGGAIVAGFAIAQTSLDGAHVKVDMLSEALSAQSRVLLLIFTKSVGIGVFVLLAWALFLKGNDLHKVKEVSQTLNVPYYPIAYGLSFGCAVECLVLLSNILKTIVRGAKHG